MNFKPRIGSIMKNSLSYQLLLILYLTLVVQGCVPKLTKRSAVDASSAAAATVRANKCENCNETQVLPNNNSSSSSSSPAADETRPKRQLFRGDIPEHRPLTGNVYALYHGFPHAGRFNDHHGNGIVTPEDGLVTYTVEPGLHELQQHPQLIQQQPLVIHQQHQQQPLIHNHHQPAVVYQQQELTGDMYKTVSHGNEIIHQYPVEVSQVIQLDHDVKSGPIIDPHSPPQVHPDQNPEPHPLKHQIKPQEPADLVVREPNGETGHTGPMQSEEHGEQPAAGPDEVHYAPYAYAGNYGYQPNPYRLLGPYSGAYKIAQFFKTWPYLFSKARGWPFRRYRTKIRHPQDYY